MRRSVGLVSICMLAVGVCVGAQAFAKGVVNVYNWAGYLPPKVIKLFEKETGLSINYSTYDDNQVLYAKLKADGGASYDVVVPSSFVVQRLWEEGELMPLDKSKLPNLKNLNTALLNQSYDPGNRYSLPYLWGTTGIVVNTQRYSLKSVQYWKDLWKPEFRGKVALLNDMRDTFGVGLKVLGYSINDTNPEHIKAAYLMLLKLWPNVQSFESNGAQQMYVNEDVNLGILESGDANSVVEEQPKFRYVYPKDGALLWVDCMVIPKHAPHLENAYQFMNFILRPDVAAMISASVGFSTPNAEALKLLPKALQENRILNPGPEDLKGAEAEGYIGKEANAVYLKYWELLKLGS